MKKVLSVILAIMMIATAVPMAFAADCSHQFDADSLVRPTIVEDGYYICPLCSEKVTLKRADYSNFEDVYIRVSSTDDHIYTSDEIAMEAYDVYMEIFDKIVRRTGGTYEEFIYMFNMHEGEQELLDDITDILNEGSKRLEQYDPYIYANGSAFVRGEYRLNVVLESFTDEEIENLNSSLVPRNEEEIIEVNERYNEIMMKVAEDPYSVTKEEYEKAMADVGDYMYKTANCAIGLHNLGAYADYGDGTHKAECSLCIYDDVAAHTWGEYYPNGDATPEADGTKTAECSICGAEDTVVDEGSKIPLDEPEDEPADEPADDEAPTNFFTRIIERIKGFFAKIADFIKNLFA